jgi:hypothetical protein
MLNRSQIETLIAIRNRPGSPFNPHGTTYRLPIDVIKQIANVGFDPDSESDIAKLLHHIAYGDLASAKIMLDANRSLIGKASHVQTPSGLIVRYVKPYECALGGGDPEMAKMIAGYFDQFTDGAAEKAAQDAKYRTHIEDMLNPEKNPPYDFTLLIETLMAAKPADVTAALNRDTTHDSALRDVLEQFRKDFTPGMITSGLHFNYQHLLRAYEVYDQNYENLYKSGGNDYDKLRLFSRQIIGFIQRSLPAIDRMVYAQSLYDVVEQKTEIKRSFKFTHDEGSFPDTSGGHGALSGLGFEYFAAGGCASMVSGVAGIAPLWKTYVEQKHQTCRTYAATSSREVVSVCNLLK